MFRQMEEIGLTDLLPQTLSEAVDTWWWLLATALMAVLLQRVFSRHSDQRESRSHEMRSREPQLSQAETPRSDHSRLGDSTAQRELISNLEFEPRRLLDRSEYGILLILERIAAEKSAGHRVMAQTSLGDVIAPKALYASEQARNQAFRSINGKRLDFLIIDRRGIPVLAVEYQGLGRYPDRAFMRDPVKQEAVKRAGIGYLEIPAEYDGRLIEDQIRSVLHPSFHATTNSISVLHRTRNDVAEREAGDWADTPGARASVAPMRGHPSPATESAAGRKGGAETFRPHTTTPAARIANASQ